MKVAVVGATGMVGRVILDVLADGPVTGLDELIAVASARSVGRSVRSGKLQLPVVGIEEALAAIPDFALFSAGSALSLEWAPRFAAAGTVVIDNSSTWRMDDSKLLVVPEVNGDLLADFDLSQGGIIANPNCSTIQLVMALAPLHARYGVERVVVSTYQSVTGSGVKGTRQLADERAGRALSSPRAYPHRIDGNILPGCDSFLDNGYTKEEMKLVWETHKILDPSIRVTATAVRVPVSGGHSEAVNVQLANDFDLQDVRTLLSATPGIQVVDEPARDRYPTPLHAKGKDAVFVGRLRRDESQPNTLNMWVVADNLRKGAATNAVQIMEMLVQQRVTT